jgi:lipopolysaccharide assembly outer membrane protein LptD (OstA)
VRFRGIAIASLSAAAFFATPVVPAFAQLDEPSEQLHITADAAATWEKPGESVVALNGPVSIELDNATLTAKQAVIWISRAPGEGNRQRAEIALIGDAVVTQKDVKRSGKNLYVTALISGKIRFTAESRVEDDRSDTELYENAEKMRQANEKEQPASAPGQPEPGVRPPREPEEPAPQAAPLEPGKEAPPPTRVKPQLKPTTTAPATTQPEATTAPGTIPPGAPVSFRGSFESVDTDDGTLAIAFTNGVTLIQSSPTNIPGQFNTVELLADRAVVFTNIKDPKKDLAKLSNSKDISEAINSAYLEGDVRVVYTPADQAQGEQRLEAKRVYYEFATHRAILTEAVVHTVQPQLGIPVVMRAKIVRQLADGEYKADDAKLSTSRFATPSYSINASKMYVRQEDTGDPRLGKRTAFKVSNPTFRFFDVPVFWLPSATGSMTDRGSILRGIGFEHSTQFGTGVETKWGLFETLGQPRPNAVDAAYQLDYYSDRGPAGGLEFDYGGGVISDTLKQDFNFEGKLESYAVYDEGFDDFGRGRVGEKEIEGDNGDPDFRGRVLYRHQHFFSDDWQLQFRAGYVSDATFLEQWFDNEFDEGPPHDVMLYVKKQQDTEAFTFLTQVQPSNVVTTSDWLQEQFEVERLPEFGYRRIGDSLLDDKLTFYTRDTVGGYRFNFTRATLAEQGFGPGRSPGIPSVGFTGGDQDAVYRGDFRQEITYPINAGAFKVVPYAVARYTPYSDSPDGGSVNRLLGAVGTRVSTAFWKQYDHVESRMFDIHRVRHVIEPEVNVFASAATDDRNDVFIYEEDVDGIHDVEALQLALHQRWQTKRGGAGRWRSVDFFTLNIEANFFANQPNEDERRPVGFRGLFFPSHPEASVPRNSLNADSIWRISDNTAVLADVQQNLDKNRLATAGIGLLVRRDERLTYFVGNRYIDELSSNITTVALSYELSPKYMLTASQSYDFGLSQNVSSSFGVIRQFDAFFMQVSASHDSTSDQSSFNFNIYPKGLGYGVNAEQLGSVFRSRQ